MKENYHCDSEFFSAFCTVMDAIPTVVCDTLYSMGLHDQTPSWKIMDSRGRITVGEVESTLIHCSH